MPKLYSQHLNYAYYNCDNWCNKWKMCSQQLILLLPNFPFIPTRTCIEWKVGKRLFLKAGSSAEFLLTISLDGASLSLPQVIFFFCKSSGQSFGKKEHLLDLNLDLSIPQPSPLNTTTVTSENLNLDLLYHNQTINAVLKEVNTIIIARALLPELFCRSFGRRF